MSLTEIVVQGTLNPDGSLELDQKPNLSPGRVMVLRQESQTASPPQENWFEFLQNARLLLCAIPVLHLSTDPCRTVAA